MAFAHPVDIDDITFPQGIDADRDIAAVLAMDHVPEASLSFKVDDHEQVEVDGFGIRVVCRKELQAKVFARRASITFGIPIDGAAAGRP